MSHFRYLWLQIRDLFRHIMGDHTAVEEKISDDISHKVEDRLEDTIMNAVKEQVDPLVQEQMKTNKLIQATIDAMKRKGIEVKATDRGAHGSTTRNRFTR